MLTPVEMQGRELKQGRGYQKKEADEFLSDIFSDYEMLYRENMELKDKVNVLSDGLKYYKDLEKTLQKTLVIAEKVAEETTKTSEKKADLIILEAKNKAADIVYEANYYYQSIQGNIKNLMQQYDNYRIQCKKLADTHIELLNSESFKVDFSEIDLKLPQMKSKLDLDNEINSQPDLSDITINQIPQEETTSIDKTIPTAKQEEVEERIPEILDNDLFEFLNLDDDE